MSRRRRTTVGSLGVQQRTTATPAVPQNVNPLRRPMLVSPYAGRTLTQSSQAARAAARRYGVIWTGVTDPDTARAEHLALVLNRPKRPGRQQTVSRRAPQVRRVRARASRDALTIARELWRLPQTARVCIRRKVRQGVLFALQIAGKSGASPGRRRDDGKRYRRTADSFMRC